MTEQSKEHDEAEQIQRLLHEQEQREAEITARLEAAKRERERVQKMQELEQRQREAEEQREFRERQLENARQLAEWQRDPFAYADHLHLW